MDGQHKEKLDGLELDLKLTKSHFDSEMGNLNRTLTEYVDKLNKLAGYFEGTDSNNPGAWVRLDRLEQSKKRTDRMIWLLISGLVATFFTVIASILMYFFKTAGSI
jgi:hypothetical protein